MGTGTGSVQGGSSWLTLIWQNFCMSFCHFVIFCRQREIQRRSWRNGGMRKRKRSGHKSNQRRRLETPPLPLCECGSGQTCHGSVRMDRSDTFGGIWRGMRQKWRRAAFFSAVSCIRMSFAAAAAGATCQLPSHHSSPAEDAARGVLGPRLARSPDLSQNRLATTKLATSNSQSALWSCAAWPMAKQCD